MKAKDNGVVNNLQQTLTERIKINMNTELAQTEINADSDGCQVDLWAINKIEEELEHKNIIEKICFSKEPCELKEKYYKAFDELPKAENKTIFGGVVIVEEDILPPNTMMWRFSNSADNRIFVYRGGKLYELPKFKPFSLFNDL